VKICWDNLERLRYNKKTGKWYSNKGITYIYIEACEKCNNSFLSQPSNIGRYCCQSCILSGRKGREHPSYGSRRSDEFKKRLDLKGKKNPFYGRQHTEETKKKISESRSGGHLTEEHKEKVSKALKNKYMGENNSIWKGGTTVSLYNTYATQLELYEEVRRCPDNNELLEVRCFKCNKWYTPNRFSARSRTQYLKSNNKYTANNFYCSQECKDSCSIFGKSAQQLIKEDAVRAGLDLWWDLEREVQPELRKMVLYRDHYQCQECGEVEQLHCHHIKSVSANPIESADIDNCITLCINCHKKIHKQKGNRIC